MAKFTDWCYNYLISDFYIWIQGWRLHGIKRCGVEIYMTVPAEQIQRIYENHLTLKPTPLTVQPWGDMAFEVRIGGYRFMIAAVKGNA